MTFSNTDIINSLEQLDSGTLNGDKHQRQDFVHRLFQYPAMMVPLSQEAVVGAMVKFLPSDAKMMDPFMGSATSLIISMKYGLNCFGQDINPLAVLLSKVKTGLFDDKKFEEALNSIISNVEKDKSQNIEINFSTINKWFTENVQIELSKLRRSITQLEEVESRRFFWIVLAETIRITSNDRTSTYKLHQRPLEQIETRNLSPIEEFSKIAKRSISDLVRFKNELEIKELLSEKRYKKRVKTCWGDTSNNINSGLKYNLLVSSPPYGDNHTTVTYGQHAYLPLKWIDLKDIDETLTSSFIRTTQEIDRISLGGKIDQKIIQQKDNLFSKSKTLKDFYFNFEEGEQKKLDKTISFIYDFDVALDNIVERLEKDAFLIWTIGNRHVSGKELKNDSILREILENKGMKFISDVEREIQGKRMPSRNNISKTMSKERILVFRKPF